MTLSPQDRRTRSLRDPLMWLAVATLLLVGAVRTKAQTPVRVTVRDSVQYKFVSTRKVDTVIRVVHDTVYVVRPPTTPPVVTPPIVLPPDPATGAPEPGVGSVILWQDAFERADPAQGYGTAPGGIIQSTDGRNGGRAVRFVYGGDTFLEKGHPSATNIYVRFYVRINPSTANPASSHESGQKFWQALRPDPAGRYTIGITNMGDAVRHVPNAGLEFRVHDNGMPGGDTWAVNQNVSTTPRFGTIRDNAWHKVTIHIVTGAGGYEQIWCDNILITDTRLIAGLPSNHDATGISAFRFPGTPVVNPSPGYTIDADDLILWRP